MGADTRLEIASLISCWGLRELMVPRSCRTVWCPKLPPISSINCQETVLVPEWPALLPLERGFRFSWHWCRLPQCHMAACPGHAQPTVVHVLKAVEDGVLPRTMPCLGPRTPNSSIVMDRREGLMCCGRRADLWFSPMVGARDGPGLP